MVAGTQIIKLYLGQCKRVWATGQAMINSDGRLNEIELNSP